MYSTRRMLAAIAFMLWAAGLTTALSDDHILIERSRSGMGMRSPARTAEFWLSETGVCTKGGRFTSIERYDLKKRWIISPQTKRYFEEPLVPSAPEQKPPVTIQHAGWDYDPVYEWSVSASQRTDTVCGILCKLTEAAGEADYSSQSLELWLATDLPINIERFNERVTASSADFGWQELVKIGPGLKKSMIMKAATRTAHPIAPEWTYLSLVTKIESVSPPPGLYDIPEGFQRVNSLDELTK
jgi:hypothetical protein